MPVCSSLRQQITAMSGTVGATSEARKYGRAIASQTFEIRKIRGERARLGCGQGSIEFIGSEEEIECDALTGAIERMQVNLDILHARRRQLLDNAATGLARQRLVAALEENGCNDDLSALVDEINFAPETAINETIRKPGAEFGEEYRLLDLGGVSTGGGLKTMCVRTCDGGFFPISSHASPTSFRRDAQVCSMMCPGTQTELFYQSLTSDDTAGMVSTENGQTYGELPNAFRFRTSGRKDSKSCGCNLQAYYKEMLKRERAAANPASIDGNSAVTWIKPQFRQTLGAEHAAPVKARPVAERPFDPEARIRKVGPDFLPDRDTSIDLTTPLPN